MPEGYKTKQRQRILNYLIANSQCHITVEDAAQGLRQKGEPVGKTTIYRYLERLVEDGLVRKFTTDGESACFQYIAGDTCQEHFHLKCVDCGKLFHLECAYLEQLEQHIFDAHHFTIHSGRTVFYGQCEDCAQKAAKAKENIE